MATAELIEEINLLPLSQQFLIIESTLNSIKNRQLGTDSPVSVSETEKRSVGRGLADLEQGKVLPHSTVRQRYEKYLSNRVDF
jgi:hypothetical protein